MTTEENFGVAPTRVKPSHDDETACKVGVQLLSEAMLAKLAKKRDHENRGGWHDPKACDVRVLADMLIEHIEKGDPVDIANFAMMLHNRRGGGKALARAYKQHVREISMLARDKANRGRR